jgi:nucleotide-binding universal stress UspA family protein
VAAIGNKFGDPADITTAADYDLFRTVGLIGDIFKAEVYPVNAYQLPQARSYIASVDGATPIIAEDSEKQKALRQHMVKQHNGTIKAMAKYFQIPSENVRVCEGHPNQVIPEVAEAVDADMIVMGATSISRLERLVSSVTVEPVMAEADCDIIVVRERDTASVPNAEEKPFFGIPKYDIEEAILNPQATFRSPQHVAYLSDFSPDFRRRILQAWEHDIRAEMVEENEGGPVQGVDLKTLKDVQAAKALLEMKAKDRGEDAGRLSSATG